MAEPTQEELEQICQERYSVDDLEWRKRIDQALDYMKIVAGNNSDNVAPQLVVHIVGENGEKTMQIYALHVPFNTPEEKRHALWDIGLKLYPQRVMPVSSFLISEAWMSTQSPAGDQPDKKECIIMAGLNMVPKRTMLATQLVERDGKNIIRLIGDAQVVDGGTPYLLMHFYKGFFSHAINAMHKNPTAFNE